MAYDLDVFFPHAMKRGQARKHDGQPEEFLSMNWRNGRPLADTACKHSLGTSDPVWLKRADRYCLRIESNVSCRMRRSRSVWDPEAQGFVWIRVYVHAYALVCLYTCICHQVITL